MNNIALACTLVFVAITTFISMKQKLGLEKEIITGTIRSAVQLLFIGFLLHFIFETNHPIFIVLIIISMITVASWNAGSRAMPVKGIRLRIALALAGTEAVTLALLLSLRIIEAEPRYIIPVSGMIIGSSMIVCGLYLNHMKRELEASRGEIETLLALGATTKQAIRQAVRRAVRSSLIPTLDGMKTVGLVQLPGMMTGMIVAGADPIEAVRYQILIVFAMSASSSLTSIVLSVLTMRLWFAKDNGRLL
ncbi:iron export ABC transporter permease subunit FetB [Paenibacillus algorifonticola]|uniref:ABC transporter permease n=1 Tax=Paenibacillus algorifonticola TaxID=684063 RepID=UPI003D2C3143